jgi:hypothetical protein
MSVLTGAVTTGFFIAVLPVIGAHVPQLSNFSQLLIGVGIVVIGRNPNGIGQLFVDVSDIMERRRGRAQAEIGSDQPPAPSAAVG